MATPRLFIRARWLLPLTPSASQTHRPDDASDTLSNTRRASANVRADAASDQKQERWETGRMGVKANRHTTQAHERRLAVAWDYPAWQAPSCSSWSSWSSHSSCVHTPFYPASTQRKSRAPQTSRFMPSLSHLPLRPVADTPVPIWQRPARLPAPSSSLCLPPHLPRAPIPFRQASACCAGDAPAQPINAIPTSTTLSLDMTAEEVGVTIFTASHEMRQPTPVKYRHARSQARQCLRFFR